MALGCSGEAGPGANVAADHSHHVHHHAASASSVEEGDGTGAADVAGDCDCCAFCGGACSGYSAAASDLLVTPQSGPAKPPAPPVLRGAHTADAPPSPLMRPPIRST